MKRSLLNFILVLGSVVLILLLLEVGFRIANAFNSGIKQGQEEFIERYAIPNSYGVPRAHVEFDLRPFFPNGELIEYPVLVKTNSHGMRMREVSHTKKRDTIRIAVLGDSNTFGWMVPESDTFVRQLETQLNQKGEQKFEVLNFGVPGYSSFHGRVHFDDWVEPYHPDILIFAYGFNDSYEARFEEKEFYRLLKQNGLIDEWRGWTLFWHDTSALARWILDRLSSPAEAQMLQEVQRRNEEDVWFPRVTQDDFQENIKVMIEQGREWGAASILMNLNLPNTWVKKPLQELANELDLPLLDVQDLFVQWAEQHREPLAKKFNLLPEGIYFVDEPNGHPILLRVYVPEDVEVKDAIYVVGNHPALGDWNPNVVALNDSGKHGDDEAGDQVWSLEIHVNVEILLNYAFTNSGPTGRWSDQNPNSAAGEKALRHYYYYDTAQLNPGEMWRSPVHEFGEIAYEELLLPNEPIHPNKKGHDMIADALENVVMDVVEP